MTLSERESRKRPDAGQAVVSWRAPLGMSVLCRVAPSNESTSNTLVPPSGVWVRFSLMNDRQNPIPKERCQLFAGDGTIIEKFTDALGVVRFDELPMKHAPGKPEDVTRPAVVFPDILEEWVDSPVGDFGKNSGLRDDYRKHDGMVHFVDAFDEGQFVQISQLAEEQKLQHFAQTYQENGAEWGGAAPKYFGPCPKKGVGKAYQYTGGESCWNWGIGAVCNQHVNFFLGYWFNYNAGFTTSASNTGMIALPMYTSDIHDFPKTNPETKKKTTIKHRGYMEFVHPVFGFGKSYRPRYTPGDPTTLPGPEDYSKGVRYMEYVRLVECFDFTSGVPNSDGERLVASLSNVSVYSVADCNSKKFADPAIERTQSWRKKHRGRHKGTNNVWEIMKRLDPADPEDMTLLKLLAGVPNFDHHCGVVVKRAPGGGPLSGVAGEPVELYTFSADGGKTNRLPIVWREFASMVTKNNKHKHLAFWNLTSLRPGGYAPVSAQANAGGISVDNLPRFIRWK